MHLHSKLKLKSFVLIFISLFLFFFTFRGFIKYLIFFTSNQLLHYPKATRQRLSELKEKNLELGLKLAGYRVLLEENKKLRKALNFKSKANYKLIGAEVLAFSPSVWQRLTVINAGKKQGIVKGLFAIDEEGNLLGRVVEADENFSRLMLVSDPDFSASVFIGESALGLLKGGVAGARVFYIEDADRIKPGDKIWLKITQLAVPIEVGKVKRLNKSPQGLFWNVEAELFGKRTFFNQLYIVK